MIGISKELEDVGRVASSFPTYLGKIEATLLAGYYDRSEHRLSAVFFALILNLLVGRMFKIFAFLFFCTN